MEELYGESRLEGGWWSYGESWAVWGLGLDSIKRDYLVRFVASAAVFFK